MHTRLPRRLTAIALLTSVFVLSSGAAAQPDKVVKSADYRPFTVVSTKLKKEMPDNYIQERLMCRSTMAALAENLDLLQNYDLISSSATDGTMSLTSFRGRQGGRAVEVIFAVDTSTRQLSYLWIDDKPVFRCW